MIFGARVCLVTFMHPVYTLGITNHLSSNSLIEQYVSQIAKDVFLHLGDVSIFSPFSDELYSSYSSQVII